LADVYFVTDEELLAEVKMSREDIQALRALSGSPPSRAAMSRSSPLCARARPDR
jgi:hypothetical protein